MCGFETGALESYRDFSTRMRNVRPNSKDAIKGDYGMRAMRMEISGPSGGPTLRGTYWARRAL